MDPDLDAKITEEACARGGTLALDWADPLHFAYHMARFGGESNFRRLAPRTMACMENARPRPAVANNDTGSAVRAEDTYQFQTLRDLGKDTRSRAAASDGASYNAAEACVDIHYVDHRAKVGVGATVFDKRTGQIIMSRNYSAAMTRQVTIPMQGLFESYHDRSSRVFQLKADISDVGAAQRADNAKPAPATHVIRSNAYLLDTPDDIVKTFTLRHPIGTHVTDQVKVSYNRALNVPDYDYNLDNMPASGALAIKLPVTLQLTVQDDYTIDKLDPDSAFRLYLTHAKGGAFHCMIPPGELLFELTDKSRTLTFGVPEKIPARSATQWSWLKNCLLADLEESISACMDIYGEFHFIVYDTASGLPRPLTVSVRSNTTESTPCNLKAQKIFLQWGCVHPDTRVMMYDANQKRIADIRLGDKVLGDDGFVRDVVNIGVGTEPALRRLRVDDGREILLTPGHPVLTASGAKMARHLRVDEYLRMADGERRLVSVDDVPHQGQVYNLHFERSAYFYGNTFAVADADAQQRDGREAEAAPVFSDEVLTMAAELDALETWREAAR